MNMGSGGKSCIDLGSPSSLLEAWSKLPPAERTWAFRRLSREDARQLFRGLSASNQAELLERVPAEECHAILSGLSHEGLVCLARAFPEDRRGALLGFLGEDSRRQVQETLAAEKGTAAGLLRTQFASLDPDASVDEAIVHFREQANRDARNIYYAYVLDSEKRLLGIVPFRQLFLGSSEKRVRDIMRTGVLKVRVTTHEDEVAALFARHGLLAIPVVDAEGRMKGIVTSDNIVSRVQREATEDIQKLGGMEALDAPYLEIGFFTMLRKRAGWLMILFLGETLTATAMGYYEKEIERAVVLALFIPLIISSGGNAGSQATTLVIRAMALGELRLRDWWRVLYRELGSGLALGLILGAIGIIRIVIWPTRKSLYGEHYLLIGLTVGLSLIGVVLWGTLAGAMLPFLLKRMRLDPASASAPFVATIVDVTGLVIYFSAASLLLGRLFL